jgi:ERCC4-type nuclease
LDIIVDSREPSKYSEFLIKTFPNEKVIVRKLDEGDYSTNKVIVERKTIADLYSSIVGSRDQPARLFNQVERLTCHTDKVVLIMVTGNVGDFIDRMKKLKVNINLNILYGALASISCRERIHIVWMDNEWNAFISMIHFMKKVDEEDYMIPHRREPNMLMAKYLGIRVKEFKALKEKFKSLKALSEATDKELTTIYGIGNVKAKRIRELMHKWD